MRIELSGYVGCSVSMDKDEWESMSHAEKRRWARDQLAEYGTVHDAAVAIPEEGDEVDF